VQHAAYGKNLHPAEVTALVAFMQTLRPSYEPPARDATQAKCSVRDVWILPPPPLLASVDP